MNSRTETELPHLFDLISSGPLAIVLGAGSSMDYGLPSWEGLRNRVLSISKNPRSEFGISDEVLRLVTRAIKENPDLTLDRIAANMTNRKQRSALQKIIGYTILDAERSSLDFSDSHWIEILANSLPNFLRSATVRNQK